MPKFNGLIVSLIAILIMSVLMYMKGGTDKANELNAKHNADLLKIERKAAIELQKKQAEIAEIESAWLDEEAETEIIYRDREKVVTKTVTEYVESNNLNHCKYDAHGVRLLNKALSNAKASAD